MSNEADAIEEIKKMQARISPVTVTKPNASKRGSDDLKDSYQKVFENAYNDLENTRSDITECKAYCEEMDKKSKMLENRIEDEKEELEQKRMLIAECKKVSDRLNL